MQSADISFDRAETCHSIEPRDHVVQLYRPGTDQLFRNVGRYLSEGLRCGETCIVIATRGHVSGFLEQLTIGGLDPLKLIQQDQLVIMDAHETLAEFMMEGQPSKPLFEQSVGRAVRGLRARRSTTSLRAYGEMVGVLWTNAQYSAAMALEDMWNDLLHETTFSLFCSYPIDVFEKSFHRCDVDAVMCSHTHMMSNGKNVALETAVSRAIDETSELGASDWKERFQTAEHPSWAQSLGGEALILWIRENHSQSADDILRRARAYYEGAQ
ncbi:MAG TPA: MEDS domain-containing protein [Bryobacteraceae bacterium]|nr:MEDS domain-containing protein [Bryobacteraceae bacterium]